MEAIAHATLFLSGAIARICEGVRAEMAKSASEHLVDVTSALKLAALAMSRPTTKQTLLIGSLALEIGNYTVGKNAKNAEC